MALRIELGEEAEEDLRQAGRHYRAVGGDELAERFLFKVRELLELIATQPDMGKDYREIALRAELAELQWFPLREFPYIIFWTHDERTLSVWSVAQAHQDLPKVLTERFSE